MELTPREQTAVFNALEVLGGLQFSEASLLPVQRRIAERIVASGLGSCARYLEHIGSSAGRFELSMALDAVTTAETYFLRQEYQLKAFAEEVLPRLAQQNARFRTLTIWSAGCSTGEEPYSLATVVLGCRELAGWKVRIVGSDISTSRLAVAREGRYVKSSFRAVDDAFKQSYFLPGAEPGEWSVKPELRKMCTFVQTNLAMSGSTSVVGAVDVAFCRNVLIYMSARAREVAVGQIIERLVPGGYLFLGHSESLLNTQLPLETMHLRDDVVYRRKGGFR
jgi:chemotaxis protein methyltransferase CheR